MKMINVLGQTFYTKSGDNYFPLESELIHFEISSSMLCTLNLVLWLDHAHISLWDRVALTVNSVRRLKGLG